MDKLRIAVCDDFKEIRKYIEFFCNKEEDVECVASASNSAECLEMVKKYKPDILLLDIQMETDDAGLNIMPDLMDIHPEMKIIILTAHLEDDYIFSGSVKQPHGDAAKGCQGARQQRQEDEGVTVLPDKYTGEAVSQ